MNQEYDLSCPVCLEIFTDPRRLGCGHTFCTKCLGKIREAGSNTVTCPLCRADHHVPEGGVEELPNDSGVLNFLNEIFGDTPLRPIGNAPHTHSPQASPKGGHDSGRGEEGEGEGGSSSGRSGSTGQGSGRGGTEQEAQAGDQDGSHYRYKLEGHETLPRLAISHNTTVGAIRKLNGLLTDDLDLLPPDTTLLLPRVGNPEDLRLAPDPAPVRESRESLMVRAFQMAAYNLCYDLKSGEARYYLHSHQWDLREAFTEWREDIIWENTTDKVMKEDTQRGPKQQMWRSAKGVSAANPSSITRSNSATAQMLTAGSRGDLSKGKRSMSTGGASGMKYAVHSPTKGGKGPAHLPPTPPSSSTPGYRAPPQDFDPATKKPSPSAPSSAPRQGMVGIGPRIGAPVAGRPTLPHGFVAPKIRLVKAGWESNTGACKGCHHRFGLFEGKHHCRHCGSLTCNPCSQSRCALPHLDYPQPVRICDSCVSSLKTEAEREERRRREAIEGGF